MKNVTLAVLVAGILLSIPSTAQNRPLRIMVMKPSTPPTYSIDDSANNEMLRSKLVSALSSRCGSLCVPVEEGLDSDEVKIDAVLMESIAIAQTYGGYQMQGTVRLVSKDGTVLWSRTIRTGFGARSLGTRFTDKVAKELVDYLEHR